MIEPSTKQHVVFLNLEIIPYVIDSILFLFSTLWCFLVFLHIHFHALTYCKNEAFETLWYRCLCANSASITLEVRNDKLIRISPSAMTSTPHTCYFCGHCPWRIYFAMSRIFNFVIIFLGRFFVNLANCCSYVSEFWTAIASVSINDKINEINESYNFKCYLQRISQE